MPAAAAYDDRVQIETLAVATFFLVAAVVLLTAAVVHQRRDRAMLHRDVERLQEVAKRRADQVSILSHEVRTPLALIRGSADLLAEQSPGPLNEVQERFVETISHSANHVISLAEDLLITARIEAGLFEVHLRRVQLRSFLRSAVRELRLVHRRDIVLDTPGPPVRVMLDPGLINQLIGNLVANSVRHDPDHANVVTVRGQVAEGMVVIAVSDSGGGMSEEERAQIFGRFHSTAALGQGAGLGLYICRHIAELHGGSIHVDTIAQHGTTMVVTFPAGSTTESEVSGEPEATGGARGR